MLDRLGKVLLHRTIRDLKAHGHFAIGQAFYTRQHEHLSGPFGKLKHRLPDSGEFVATVDVLLGRRSVVGKAHPLAIGDGIGFLARFPTNMVDSEIVGCSVEIGPLVRNDGRRMTLAMFRDAQERLLVKSAAVSAFLSFFVK